MKASNSNSIAIQLRLSRIYNRCSSELFERASRTGAVRPLSYLLCEAKP